MTQHPFLALTDADREEMLATIGVASIDELFRDLPQAVRFGRELDLEPALSEQEVFAHVAALAEQNADAGSELSFLGAGIYDHYVPAVVDTIPTHANSAPSALAHRFRITSSPRSTAYLPVTNQTAYILASTLARL